MATQHQQERQDEKKKPKADNDNVMDGLSVQHGSTPEKSESIIVLWGWIGGQLRHVEKYAQIYHEEEFWSGSKKVTTISGVTTSLYKAFYQGLSATDHYVLETTREIAKVLLSRQDAGIPPPKLVFHIFSNGGGIPLVRLHQLMQQATTTTTEETNQKLTPSTVKDLLLVQEAMKTRGGVIYDSCPAYPSSHTVSLALSSSLQKVLPSLLCHVVYFGAFCCFRADDLARQYILGRPIQPEVYWKTCKEHCGRPAKYHLFLFSSQDQITIADKVREFASYCRSDDCPHAVWVKEVDFHDSKHVVHYRKHPQEYIEAMKELFEAIEKNDQPTNKL